VELLFLDSVLHLTTDAVETIVEITAYALETRDHPVLTVPGLGAVGQVGETVLLHAAALEQAGGGRKQ
jgi:hypothetical protein